jgi:hypothetical protein
MKQVHITVAATYSKFENVIVRIFIFKIDAFKKSPLIKLFIFCVNFEFVILIIPNTYILIKIVHFKKSRLKKYCKVPHLADS